MNKKLLSVLLTLCLVVSLFAGLTVSASATDNDYWTKAPFIGDDGYYKVYYETSWIGGSNLTVTTAAQLASVPLLMSGTAYYTDSTGHLLGSTGNYITNLNEALLSMAFDYGMNITLGASFSVADHYWTPIGTSSQPYCCTFDGAGYTISGLRISSTASNQGLFGVISSAATVKNLTVSSPSVTGGKNTGAVVGLSYGTVQNCTAGSTSNLWISGTNNVSSACIGAGVGGVVGGSFGANSKVLNCTNYAVVNGTSTNTYTGGVVGKAEGTVTGCANHRSVTGVNYAGGVIGYLSSTGYYNTTDTNDGTVTCTASSVEMPLTTGSMVAT